MGDLSMLKVFKVRSRLRDYEVRFVKHGLKAIGHQKNAGDFLVIDADLPGAAKIRGLFPQEKVIAVKADEGAKTFEGCTALIEKLVARQIRRNDLIFAVGGGVVQDMVAFVSTVLFRGVQWVFVPTTLLAQADSCIGSKSSINLRGYKNLLGSFYPPSAVLIDVQFLKTLPPQEIRSGIGEILHFYLVAGKDKLAQQMMAGYEKYLQDPRQLKPYIAISLKVKKAVIEQDELDQGRRQLFNYGHTFGHAIESVSRYQVNHGQAVTMGMDIANYLSWRLGHMRKETFLHLRKILSSNRPAFKFSVKQWPRYLQALSRDKKNTGKDLGCILTRGPGKMFKAKLAMNGPSMAIVKDYWGNGLCL
jgi:3-dehydroquinate synthase